MSIAAARDAGRTPEGWAAGRSFQPWHPSPRSTVGTPGALRPARPAVAEGSFAQMASWCVCILFYFRVRFISVYFYQEITLFL